MQGAVASPSRTEAFGQGAVAGHPLASVAAQYNAQVPHNFMPDSVLQRVLPSGIGSSAQDRARMTLGGGFLPTQNGMSAGTYERARPFQSVIY